MKFSIYAMIAIVAIVAIVLRGLDRGKEQSRIEWTMSRVLRDRVFAAIDQHCSEGNTTPNSFASAFNDVRGNWAVVLNSAKVCSQGDEGDIVIAMVSRPNDKHQIVWFASRDSTYRVEISGSKSAESYIDWVFNKCKFVDSSQIILKTEASKWYLPASPSLSVTFKGESRTEAFENGEEITVSYDESGLVAQRVVSKGEGDIVAFEIITDCHGVVLDVSNVTRGAKTLHPDGEAKD